MKARVEVEGVCVCVLGSGGGLERPDRTKHQWGSGVCGLQIGGLVQLSPKM